jgi:hypothetical protein
LYERIHFAFLSNSENGQRKDDLMHAFPNTTFVDNHAQVRIIRRNLMVVFSSAPHASSLDAHGLDLELGEHLARGAQ